MRITAYSLILFYVSLNISLYLIGEAQVFPYMSQEPYETPENIQSQLLTSFIAAALGAGLIAGIIGSLVAGGVVGLIIFALTFFLSEDSVFYWVFAGTPAFINQAATAHGIDTTVINIFTGVITGLTSVVWFWFLIGLISQRYMEQ